jgi:hypothetical protein
VRRLFSSSESCKSVERNNKEEIEMVAKHIVGSNIEIDEKLTVVKGKLVDFTYLGWKITFE